MTTTTFAFVPAGLQVDAGRRTITGLAVPYGTVAETRGDRFRFEPGSLQWSELGRVKLMLDHDVRQAVGHAVEVVDTDAGLWVRFSVAPGPEGDRALTMAAHHVIDGLSVGVDFTNDDFTVDDHGVQVIARADLREVSLTPMPAFDDARVHSVAASLSNGGHVADNDSQTPPEAPEAAVAVPQVAFTVEQLGALRGLFTAPQAPEGPTLVNPVRPIVGEQPAEWTGPVDKDGLGPLMPNREQVVQLARAVNDRQPLRIVAEHEPHQTFATVTTTQTGRPVSYLGGRAGLNPVRIAEIVGITTDNVGRGGSAAFPVFGAGAAATAAEGAVKAEYAAVTPGAVTPLTIAVWTDLTDQVTGIANFESKLRNRLARLIAIRENELLRATVAATVGIGTQAFTAGDQAVQILRAAAAIEAANGVRPDLMLFNPADTLAIFGTSVSNAAPQEIAELSVRIFGMVGLPLATQPAGFVLVGAWAAATQLVVGNGLTYMVDPFTQMKNNISTLLAEEAVALAVEEPTGFTSVDIVTP